MFKIGDVVSYSKQFRNGKGDVVRTETLTERILSTEYSLVCRVQVYYMANGSRTAQDLTLVKSA